METPKDVIKYHPNFIQAPKWGKWEGSHGEPSRPTDEKPTWPRQAFDTKLFCWPLVSLWKSHAFPKHLGDYNDRIFTSVTRVVLESGPHCRCHHCIIYHSFFYLYVFIYIYIIYIIIYLYIHIYTLCTLLLGSSWKHQPAISTQQLWDFGPQPARSFAQGLEPGPAAGGTKNGGVASGKLRVCELENHHFHYGKSTIINCKRTMFNGYVRNIRGSLKSLT